MGTEQEQRLEAEGQVGRWGGVKPVATGIEGQAQGRVMQAAESEGLQPRLRSVGLERKEGGVLGAGRERRRHGGRPGLTGIGEVGSQRG